MGEKKQKLSIGDKAKGFGKGFKAFITKGNVVDLAIGVVVGGAFGKIITSLVNDIIMPPIGLLIGNKAFSDLKWNMDTGRLDDTGAQIFVSINYGNFIQTILEFLIIAFAIYAVVTLLIRRKQFNEKLEAEAQAKLDAEKAKEPEVVEVPADIQLLTEIRDLLKK